MVRTAGSRLAGSTKKQSTWVRVMPLTSPGVVVSITLTSPIRRCDASGSDKCSPVPPRAFHDEDVPVRVVQDRLRLRLTAAVLNSPSGYAAAVSDPFPGLAVSWTFQGIAMDKWEELDSRWELAAFDDLLMGMTHQVEPWNVTTIPTPETHSYSPSNPFPSVMPFPKNFFNDFEPLLLDISIIQPKHMFFPPSTRLAASYIACSADDQ